MNFGIEDQEDGCTPSHIHSRKGCGGRNAQNSSSEYLGFEFIYKLVKAHEKAGNPRVGRPAQAAQVGVPCCAPARLCSGQEDIVRVLRCPSKSPGTLRGP